MINLIKVKTGASRYSFIHRADESNPATTHIYKESDALEMSSNGLSNIINYRDSYLFTEKKAYYLNENMVLDDSYELND